MESSSDAENVEGQLGVIQCKMGSNPYRYSYGDETWWVESPSDTENVEGQLGVIPGKMGSNPYR